MSLYTIINSMQSSFCVLEKKSVLDLLRGELNAMSRRLVPIEPIDIRKHSVVQVEELFFKDAASLLVYVPEDIDKILSLIIGRRYDYRFFRVTLRQKTAADMNRRTYFETNASNRPHYKTSSLLDNVNALVFIENFMEGGEEAQLETGRILRERTIGENLLPPRVKLVAIANYFDTQRILTPIANSLYQEIVRDYDYLVTAEIAKDHRWAMVATLFKEKGFKEKGLINPDILFSILVTDDLGKWCKDEGIEILPSTTDELANSVGLTVGRPPKIPLRLRFKDREHMIGKMTMLKLRFHY